MRANWRVGCSGVPDCARLVATAFEEPCERAVATALALEYDPKPEPDPLAPAIALLPVCSRERLPTNTYKATVGPPYLEPSAYTFGARQNAEFNEVK